MTYKILVSFLAFLLLGAAWSRNPTCTNDVGGTATVGAGFSLFYCFTDATDSDVVVLTGKTTTICLDPNTDATGTADATVYLMKCLGQVKDTNECEKILVYLGGTTHVDDLPLNGDSGVTSGKQRMCIYDVPQGHYFIDVTTSANGKSARVTAEGN